MKKIIALSVLSLSLMLVSCNENAAKKIKSENLELAKERDKEIKIGGPKLKFDKTEHDFGVINEGDVVETVFTFTNSGKSELIITSAKGSCGCTVPEWPKEPIMPGDKGTIKVKFNSDRKPNLQQKQITLVTNTDQGKEILKIKAQVTPKAKVQQNS
ncbi:DUF1573 domain-containing protein [Lutimonas zeaxanthinifaciens]|uniref:DUF1573 domain-containing protein n=1 Tax=Lutimonas zeaxanthinifaciens TaxID=3060215 RepID=UPI00265CC0BC|nr:DUF1573 domain-containing protein [Lutimonas sp. YSD2104]WKK67220.1 DUF1573 domain-containing protein [Lutimonas sp. YSD2104]